MKKQPSPKVLALVVVLALFPHLPFVSFSILGNVNTAATYALVAISLVVLTGWSGNISLGHGALVGVGAFVTGLIIQGWHIPFPVNLVWAAAAGAGVAAIFGVFALRIRGLYLAVATLIFSWMADEFLFRQKWFTKAAAVEVPPLGREGTFPYFDWTQRTTFYYAAWATVLAALFLAANLRDSKTGRGLFAVRGSEIAAASLGIDVVKTKLLAFAVSGALAGAAGNLVMIGQQVVTQDQFRISRSLFFLSIAVVGGLASLGGAVASALLFAMLDEVFFRVTALSGYLEVVSAALLTATLLLYPGGLAAVPGAVRRRLVRFRPAGSRAPSLRDWLAPAGRWLASVAARPRGLPRPEWAVEVRPPGRFSRAASALAERAGLSSLRSRRAVRREPPLDLFAIRLPGDADPEASNGGALHENGGPHRPEIAADAAAVAHEIPAGENGGAAQEREVLELGEFHFRPRPVRLPADRDQRRLLIEAAGITVRFGGLTAVNDFSMSVREGEIVGLIGPNGAGKTTLFNAIAGLNLPAAGRVRYFGEDVTDLPPHLRARLGVGRTFQAIQLFPQLSVFENLLVATHMDNPTGLGAHAFVTGRSLDAERRARAQARRAIHLLELDDVAGRVAGGLPFGVLRMVELARALVTGARVIMLDEPASGLDTKETDRLADILRFVRSLGVTLLLIEHDVRMVTAVSDYIHVIDRGNLLAEGPPDAIKRDPRVIAAYLGESFAETDAAAR